MIVALVGAGPLATALASTLAARGRVRHIRLIDDAGTVAAGKALDVRQATPVLGTDVAIDATTDVAAAIDADVIVIADVHGAPAVEWEGELGLGLVSRLAAANPRAPIVCAGARQASLVERGVAEVRLPWTRILGSASIAFDAAARAVVADAAGTAPRAVALRLAVGAEDQAGQGDADLAGRDVGVELSRVADERRQAHRQEVAVLRHLADPAAPDADRRELRRDVQRRQDGEDDDDHERGQQVDRYRREAMALSSAMRSNGESAGSAACRMPDGPTRTSAIAARCPCAGVATIAGSVAPLASSRCSSSTAAAAASANGPGGQAAVSRRAAVASAPGASRVSAGTAPRAVALGLAGLPPSRLVVGWSASSIEGVPAETRLGPGVLASATRRLTAAWPPGPFALATAAAVLLEHLDDAGAAALPAIVATPAQGHRAAIALVRVGPSGVLHAAEPALSPYERIALDNAIAFRR